MQTYTLPRETFNLLLEMFGEQQKAEIVARTLESAIVAIDNKTTEGLIEKKEMVKIEVREELRKELVTREMFESLGIEMRERFNVVDEKFRVVNEKFKSLEDRMDERLKSMNFKLNLFLAIALIALTFANPTFVVLLQKLF